MQPWPKIFHALRSSRETELAAEHPIHVVTAWLGNTPTIALRHYLLTTDADFDRAADGQEAAQKQAQQVAEMIRHDSHGDTENPGNQGKCQIPPITVNVENWGTRIRT